MSLNSTLPLSPFTALTLPLLPLLLFLSLAEPAPKTKRMPVAPKDGFLLENVTMETITAIPYDIIKEGLQ